MVEWLYFVQSNDEYHDLMSFVLGGRDADMISYLVFNEGVKANDGRMFHTSNGYLLAVNFLSHSSDLGKKMAKVGLNPNSLVDLYEIVSDDNDPMTKAITITESAECIIFDKKLERFVVDKHFKFSDGSALTIPLVCRKHRL